MSKQQFEGRSAAEAAIKACETLGVTRSELKYEVVSDTGELMARKVVIAVEPVAPKSDTQAPRSASVTSHPAAAAHRGGEDFEEQPGDNRGNSAYGIDHGGARPERRGSRPPRNEGRQERRNNDRNGNSPDVALGRGSRNEASRNDKRRGDSQPGWGNNDGGDKARRPERDSSRGRRNDSRTGRGRDGQVRGHHEGIDSLLTIKASSPDDARHAAVVATSARSKRALTVVGQLLELMGMQADVVLVADGEAEIQIHLYGADESRIVGRKGEVLLALQFIVNRILSREEDEGEQVVVLDAGSYRERRQKALEDLARTLAERSVQERKAVRLSPMSAHDRRIFHMVLKDIDTVASRSEGDGLYRHLLIIPAEFC